MHMSCIVWEPSDWFRLGKMVRKSEVSSVLEQWFGNRKSVPFGNNGLEIGSQFRFETMVRKSEVIGNGRKASEKFGSRKSSEHKERTFELLLYDSKK